MLRAILSIIYYILKNHFNISYHFSLLSQRLQFSALLCFIAIISGLIIQIFNVPMPFLIGGLIGVAIFCTILDQKHHDKIVLPKSLSSLCLSIIGAMIGTSFSPEIISILPMLIPSLVLMILYVLVTFVIGYRICRFFGYDKGTSLLSAMPGGVIEAISLGDKLHADQKIIAIHHFGRIMLLILTVPLAVSYWTGHLVGSAAGEQLSSVDSAFSDIMLIFIIAYIGPKIGKLCHIPARHVIGAALVSIFCHAFGIIDIHSPTWLLNAAQLVIGMSLGTRFINVKLTILFKALLNAVLLMTIYTVLALLMVMVIMFFYETKNPELLFVSFVPGGVPEMGLVALSLQLSPIIVIIHHFVRIFFVLVFIDIFIKYFYNNTYIPPPK